MQEIGCIKRTIALFYASGLHILAKTVTWSYPKMWDELVTIDKIRS